MRRRLSGDMKDNGGLGDFVDVLLDLEMEEKLSDSDMIAILWIDPNILRGRVIEFSQKLFDMSIKARAKQMEEFLRSRSISVNLSTPRAPKIAR